MTSSHIQRVRILYKTILRLHRGLPIELQPLGNSYVRDEFKRHKSCDEATANTFMTEWIDYAISLTTQLGLRGPHTAQPLGKHLKGEEVDTLREEQIYQLYELMIVATNKDKSNVKDS